MVSQELTPRVLASQDAVLIATNHACYDYPFIVKHSRLAIDTRNACGQVKAGAGRSSRLRAYPKNRGSGIPIHPPEFGG